MKRLKLFFAAVLILGTTDYAAAYDLAFENRDGVVIYYNYNGQGGVAVAAHPDGAYAGDIVIHDTVSIVSGYSGENYIEYRRETFKVNAVSPWAFANCTDLTSVTLGKYVETIYMRAFAGCTGLISIVLPDSLKEIDGLAFGDCSSLREVRIPDKVTTIGLGAFSGCNRLASLTIGNAVTNIRGSAFYGCSSLTSVVIPNSVTAPLESSAFLDCSNLRSVTIGNSLPSILSGAFQNCSSLKEITIPANVKYIDRSAFMDCTELHKFIFEDGSDTLNFGTDTWLSSVDVVKNCPVDTVYIGRDIIYSPFKKSPVKQITIGTSVKIAMAISVDSLIEYVVAAENPNFMALDGVLFSKDASVLFHYPNMKPCASYSVPNSVDSIGENSFNNQNLTSLTIPKSVNAIEYSAFSGCNNLTDVVLEDGATDLYLGTYAFHGNAYIKTFYDGRDLTGSFRFSTGSTNQSLTTVVIGDSVTVVDSYFFSSCKNLTSVILGSSVETIGSYAFSNCSALTTITIPKSVVSIGSYAFSDCTGLESIIIPDSVVSIDNCAFQNCKGLTSITLSSTVATIGSYAFYNCYTVGEIHSRNLVPPEVNANTFNGISKSKCKLYVPQGSLAAYRAAAVWKDFVNIEEEVPLTITATSVPYYGGEITGINSYNYNDEASITANAYENYDFKCWMENETVVSTDRTYNFTVTAPRTLCAVFTPRENADENISIASQEYSATISWTAVSDAANYVLIVYDDETRTNEIAHFLLDVNGNIQSNPVMRSALQNLSCNVDGLNPESTYYYMLTSYNADNLALTILVGDFATATTTGFKNILQKQWIDIYPNPVQEGFYVQGISSPTAQLTLLDMNGRIILSKTVSDNEYVSIAALSGGVYIARLALETGTVELKIIKK